MYYTRADYLQPTDTEGNCQWTKGGHAEFNQGIVLAREIS